MHTRTSPHSRRSLTRPAGSSHPWIHGPLEPPGEVELAREVLGAAEEEVEAGDGRVGPEGGALDRDLHRVRDHCLVGGWCGGGRKCWACWCVCLLVKKGGTAVLG